MSSMAVVLLLLLLLAPIGVAAMEEDDDGFLLLDCGHPASSDSHAATTAPPPHSAAGPGSKNVSIAGIRDMLASLPAFAARQGFGTLSLGGGSGSGASVRGVCIGDASPSDCRACLAAAARRVTAGCGDLLLAGARRAGAWSDACFLAYYADAGAGASSPADDRRTALCRGDFASSLLDHHHRFAVASPRSPEMTLSRVGYEVARRAAAGSARMYAAGDAGTWHRGDPTVHAVAQCARDRAAGECLECLRASTRQADLSCPAVGTGWLQTARVLSYGCYMRFEVKLDPVSTTGGAAVVACGGAFLRWIIIAIGALVAVI